jgi:hypothetical protein
MLNALKAHSAFFADLTKAAQCGARGILREVRNHVNTINSQYTRKKKSKHSLPQDLAKRLRTYDVKVSPVPLM